MKVFFDPFIVIKTMICWVDLHDNIIVIVDKYPSSGTTYEYFLPGLRLFESDGHMHVSIVTDLPSYLIRDGDPIIIPDHIRKSHASLSKYAPNLLMNVDIKVDRGMFKLAHKSSHKILDIDLELYDVDMTFDQTICCDGKVYMSIDNCTPEYLGSLKGTLAFEMIKRDVTHKSYENFRGFSDIDIVIDRP